MMGAGRLEMGGKRTNGWTFEKFARIALHYRRLSYLAFNDIIFLSRSFF